VAARARKRKVFDALNNRTWVSDIRRGLTVQVLNEYIHLWELFSNVELQPDVEDTHIRQFSNTGQYTSKSAYEALFIGAIQFGPWESVSLSCGQQHTKDAGQQTGWQEKGYNILLPAHFLTRLRKQ
jgi:hypothetical protein